MRHDKRMKMYNEGMTNIAKFFFFLAVMVAPTLGQVREGRRGECEGGVGGMKEFEERRMGKTTNEKELAKYEFIRKFIGTMM